MRMAIIANTEAITPKMMVPVRSGLGFEEFVDADVASKAVVLGDDQDERVWLEAMVRLEASGAIIWEMVERKSLLWSKYCCC
jgi:hypothetical protein